MLTHQTMTPLVQASPEIKIQGIQVFLFVCKVFFYKYASFYHSTQCASYFDMLHGCLMLSLRQLFVCSSVL